MTGIVHHTLEIIERHSAWALPILFIVTFGESFAFLSLIFPGTTIMIAAGVLVANGTLPFFPVLIGGIMGAILGDGVSYWFGKRYGRAAFKMWPLSRSQALLVRGEKLFKTYGAWSVFIGRFFGPLRAVVPLVAGIVRMPTRIFWLANIASALIWAPALLLPGVMAILLAEAVSVGRHWRPVVAIGIAVVILILVWFLSRSKLFERLGKLLGLGDH